MSTYAATTANNFSGSLAGDVTGTQGATAVGNFGGQTAANVASGAAAANAAVAIVWPTTQTLFSLQENTDLNTTNWVSVAAASTEDGTNTSVIVTPAAGNRFFRLKWPWWPKRSSPTALSYPSSGLRPVVPVTKAGEISGLKCGNEIRHQLVLRLLRQSHPKQLQLGWAGALADVIGEAKITREA